MRHWKLPLLFALGLFGCLLASAQGTEEAKQEDRVSVTYYYLPG